MPKSAQTLVPGNMPKLSSLIHAGREEEVVLERENSKPRAKRKKDDESVSILRAGVDR